MLITASVLTRQ